MTAKQAMWTAPVHSHAPAIHPMPLQCAWCLEWISGSAREGGLLEIDVSHGLCNCCMERLVRSRAKT